MRSLVRATGMAFLHGGSLGLVAIGADRSSGREIPEGEDGGCLRIGFDEVSLCGVDQVEVHRECVRNGAWSWEEGIGEGTVKTSRKACRTESAAQGTVEQSVEVDVTINDSRQGAFRASGCDLSCAVVLRSVGADALREFQSVSSIERYRGCGLGSREADPKRAQGRIDAEHYWRIVIACEIKN